MQISDRQKEILLAIIKEYMDSAQDVGSSALVEKYELGVSSATIRSEMVKLMEMGFLSKSHISAGRLPTDLAFRFYVNQESNKSDLDVLEQTRLRQEIFGNRFDAEKLTNKILKLLVENTRAAGFVLLDDTTRHYGVSSLLNYDELRDVDLMQRILDFLEDANLLNSVFSKYDSQDVKVLIGSELGIKNMQECALVFTKFNFWDNRSGHLGLIGSRRINYSVAIPVVTEVRNSVESSLTGWK